MTKSEVLRLFEAIKCARIGAGFAPHKPIVVLLMLEMIANGHENRFAFREFDTALRRILAKYGSPSAADARNEPFWRLQNDGIFEFSPIYSPLLESARTPTPAQLVDYDVSASVPDELYQALRFTPNLITEVGILVANTFLGERIRRSLLAEAAPSIARARRSYWWVNQNRTYREEVHGDFMWSPVTSADGRTNPNYEFMRQVDQGDVIFSFSASQIKAIGVVKQRAVACPKPTTFGSRGNQWLNDGWLVEVAFYELGPFAIRPSEHMAIIAPTLPARYSPIRVNGIGNQVYLTPVPPDMANVLLALVGPAASTKIVDVSVVLLSDDFASKEDDTAFDEISARPDIGSTTKEQLIRARRGQGLFRAGVSLIEERCRLTRVADKIHLVASHIKPWASSTDDEHLNRYNGLLLAPHADHLFDHGYLSFENDGRIIVSQHLDRSILRNWHIDEGSNVGSFRSEQHGFLEYHRDAVLKR